MKGFLQASAALFAVLTVAVPAYAWGTVGHRLVSRAGAEAFPASLPAFVRTPTAIDEIAALGPELDRSKGAGTSHDLDLDPGHYVDIDDSETIAGVVTLTALSSSRQAYEDALRGAHTDGYRMGYLPYALIDGWEQIAKDFAIWRIDAVGERMAVDARLRARFIADRSLREALTLRDIGVWSHYVGDASQPLHTSIHFNGWGDAANPDNFTTSHQTHAAFESSFVDQHATLASVRADMHPQATLSAPIAQLIGTYVLATHSNVIPFYRLEKAGAFAHATPEAVAFADARLAAGACELRDLVVAAYDASATLPVGYPNGITPAQAERGAAPVPLTIFGDTPE